MNESEHQWKTLEEEILYQSLPWIDLRRQTIRLPGGQLIPDYHRLILPDYVAVVAVDEAGMIILNKQYKHAVGTQTYTLPGGMVDESETPLQAAKRELREETGYIGGHWKSMGSMIVHGNLGAGKGHYFFVSGVCDEGKVIIQSDLEDIRPIKLRCYEVKHLVRIGQIALNNHVAGLGLAVMRGFI